MRDRDTLTRDLNAALQDVDGRDLYAPIRVRHLCRILDTEQRVVEALLNGAPSMRPLYQRMQAAGVAHVQALEDLHEDSDFEA